MKFGVREICEVVFKAKAPMKVGKKLFYKDEPVIYFDTLKTSGLEGAATTVYAQGGRGNSRLVAWEGERTVTFTMEDALISKEGFMILTGAGLIEAGAGKDSIKQHITETIDVSQINFAPTKKNEDGEDVAVESAIMIPLEKKPYMPEDVNGHFAYVMLVKDGEIISEPFIPERGEAEKIVNDGEATKYGIFVKEHKKCYEGCEDKEYTITDEDKAVVLDKTAFDSVIVDYYTERESGAYQINITPDKFGGNYYVEASTLFRNTNGEDLPAEFIIPNCKVQSNFNFSMAATGDPSTFTFTMDAFPDYTRFDHSKKVLCAIQVIEDKSSNDLHRHSTKHESAHDELDWD